jgi:hypothetical protein
MSISAVCACAAQIEAPDHLAGRSVTCPQCGAAVAIPSSAAGDREASFAENYREDGQVPAELKAKALAELGPDEHVVWIAQPVGAIVFRRSLGYFVGAGLVALASLYFLLVGGFLAPKPAPAAKGNVAARQKEKAPAPAPAANTHGMGQMIGLSLLFLVGSAGCAVVPFYRWKMAQGTCYALTNRRALVYKAGLFGPTRESYSPLEVAAMRRADSWVFAAGGDLIFRSVTVVTTSYNRRGGSSSSVRTTYYGFLAIANVKEVEKLVRETLIDRFVDRLQEASAV